MYINSEERIKNIIFILPIIFIITVIPIIVYAKVIPLQSILIESWTGEEINYDFFTYYKAALLFTVSIIALILLVLRRWKEEFFIKKGMFYIPVFIYIIFVIFSTIFSDTRFIAAFGFVERHEGIYIIIVYLINLFVAFNSINDENDIKLIVYSLMCYTLIIGLIGIFQYFGFDLFQTSFGKLLILPKEIHHITDSLKYKVSAYTIYATMGNSNYVGSYMAMVFPVSFGLYLQQSKLKNKIFWGLLSCLMFVTWIGCRSRAGMVGGLIAIILVIILYIKSRINNMKRFIILIPYILIFVIMNQASGGSLLNKVSTINPLIEQNFADDRNVDLEDIIISNLECI